MDKKELKNDIKQLKKNKQYDKIFEMYGQKVFLENSPKKYKTDEIKQLMKEGKYEDIHFKYGQTIYNSLLQKMKEREIYSQTNSKFEVAISRLKYIMQKRVAPLFMSTTFLLSAGGTVIGNELEKQSMKEINQNYSKELQEYNDRIEPYVEYLKKQDLTQLQLIMKILDDMHADIEGYGTPKISVPLYGRIDFAEEGGVGVCRNMADHLTTVLNEINPSYNARNFMVYADFGEEMNIANVERKLANEEVIQGDITEEEMQNNRNGEPTNFTKQIGNHAITILELQDEDLTILVDSTNPAIGVYVDGKIQMLSNDDLKINSANIMNAISRGKTGTFQTISELTQSITNRKLDINQLEEKFGVEAQNKALEEVQNMNLLNWQEVYEQSGEEFKLADKNSEFRQKYAVDTEELENKAEKNSHEEVKNNDEIER